MGEDRSVTLLVASTGRYLSGARLSFFIVADLALAVPRRFFASTTDISHLRMKLLSGVLLLLLGQALACPFRVEIISNEHGKTQVNVITEESTDGVKNQTEANQPMASGESSKKYVPNEEQHQYLGLQQRRDDGCDPPIDRSRQSNGISDAGHFSAVHEHHRRERRNRYCRKIT